MKLKLRIFALMAMLLCFAFQANAQVAKIGETEYSTFGEALTAAREMSGDVTVEVYSAVEFVDGMELDGSYTSIKFLGKDVNAKITIAQTAGGDYLTAHGKTVAFENLILAKANPAWSNNSAHMGNYFSIQGGAVTYTDCTFPNGACTSGGVATYVDCTFQNTSEYGLWVYDDALVTVNGGTIDSKKGIKVYSEDESSVTSTLTVENATFTENVTAKPAVAVGYAQNITLIGNTYNNSTAVVELDSGSDADCEGIVFVVEDSEGNDISSELTVVDRSNSGAACGVLVDGKIYITAAQAAAVATEGSNVTLLYSTTDAVEFAEGVNLTLANGVTADSVTVKVTAPVEVDDFEELKAAVEAGKKVKLTADITTTAAITTSGVTSEIDLNGKTLTIGAGDNKFCDASNITIKNGTISITGLTVGGNAVFCLDEYEKTLVTTLTLENVNLVGDGYSSAYCIFYIGDSSVLNVKGGVWNLKNDASTAGGVFKGDASAATLNIDGLNLTAHNVRRVVLYAATTIENSTLAISGDADGVDAEMEHGFNRSPLAISNSTITMTDMVGRGITAENGAVIIENSTVTMTNCQEATIDVRGGQTVTIDDASTVELDKEPTITSGTISGDVVLPVYVAQIGETKYTTLADAIAAAQAGDVVKVFEGTYDLPSMKAGITIEGEGNVLFEGTLSGTLENLTLKNLHIKGANAQRWAYAKGDLVFENVTFEATSIYALHFDGITEGATLLYKDCTIIGWAAMSGSPASCVFDGCTIKDNGTYGVIRTYFDATIENCTFDVANANPNDVYQDGIHAVGGAEIVVNDCTNANGDMKDIVNVSSTSVVALDGVEIKNVAKVGDDYYTDLQEAVSAAESGATITLMNGEHELPIFSNKELTFVGESKDGVIVNDAPDARTQGWVGSTIHFENLTAKGATENYHGLANGVVAVTYKNCNINGLRFLYAATVSFDGCAFNAQGVEHSFWTYGSSDITVTNSTFTYTDRAVNCYSENGAEHETDIAFSGCTFTYAGTADAPEGAVEINSGSSKSIDLTMDDCDAPEKGAMWFNSQWDSKKGENTVVTVDGEIVWQVAPVAKIGDVEYKSLQAALNAAAAGTGNVTVTIIKDVDLTDVTWDPVTVSGPGYPEVTVEGNYMTITGLTDMLFAGTWAGGSGLIIKNLTIENSAIVNDKEDSEGTVGVGAFIGYPQASATITLENCHLKNSSVEGGHWTGGLIGMAGGYNGTDGPVFMNLTIKGCSVTGSTITGKGSAGGVIGHGSCAAWTNVVIEETIVSGNTITSTGSSTNKAGAVMGTIGAAGQATTVNGETKTGGASVSATVESNNVKSNGTEITTIYGRQGSATGMLYVAGGSYDNYPIEQGVAYAAPIEGYVIVENADGTYGLDEKVELPEVVITDIKGSLTDSDPDLTFALNFSIKDLENLTDEYLEKLFAQYGSWYTDYVLTISGLTDENVTFNANGNGDGYLAGQYDAWSENWVSVPFEDVTLANGESIYIMEYAAKLMGQSGLRLTLAEVAEIVQNFDCGVYFTPEFLTANPDLKVDLHLKVFTEDAEGNKVNDINVATNNFDVEDYVAIVHADGKQTTYCTTLADAVAAAEADEAITLIADVELTETLTIPADKTVALDLNGKTVSMADASGATAALIKNNGNLTITDGTEGKAGKLSFNSTTPSANNGYACNTISNYGTITIEAGTIENTTVGGACYALDNYAGSTATINGGKLTAEKTAVRIFNWTNGDAAKATLNVNGGEIYSKDGYAINVNSGNAPAVALNITGGTITTDDTDYNLAVYVVNKDTAENFTASVTGGTFNGYYALNGITSATMEKGAVSITDGTFTGVICYDEPAYGFISGGTYAYDVNDYCADGYVCEANENGTYGVVSDPGYVAEWTFDDSNSVDYTNDTDLTVGTLTFKRTFIADIWNPLYLPFDIELTDELLAQFEFYEYNQMLSTDTDGDRVPDDFAMELFVFQGGTLEANYPYFVRPKNADACTIEVVMNKATLYAAEENSFETASMKNIFTLSGTHKSMTADELAGKFVMSTEGKWQPAGSNMKSHRLYLSITDRNGNSIASKAIRMVVRGEDGFEGTTGVDIVETDNAADGTIYDLSGRPVVEPVKGSMYIINGKKVVY